MTHSDPHPNVDFRKIFEATHEPNLIVLPNLMIAAVNEAYLKATSTTLEEIIGRYMFGVFPDNPEDPEATGVANLRASFQRVLETGAADTMPIQKYDILIPAEGGKRFEVRYWSPVNTPVLDDAGNVAYIIHRVEDVTHFMQSEWGKSKSATPKAEEADEKSKDASALQANPTGILRRKRLAHC